ncbi:MAG: ABC transporter substrate-binding protein [archaeon]
MKSKNKTLLTWLVILIIIILVINLLIFIPKQQDETIKIGAILALTGSIANQGEWIQNGLEFAKDEINSNNGINGKKIEIIYEDAQVDPKLAINSYNKLRNFNNVNIIITMGSGVGIALTPLVNEDKVIQIGVATASPDYSTQGDFTFRTYETADLEMKNLATIMYNDFNIRKVASLYINNDYGEGVKRVFEEEFKNLGGEIVISEAFNVGDVDFRTHINKVKASKPDALYIAPYTKEGGYLLKNSKELDLDLQIFSSQAIFGGEELFTIAGDAAEGLFIAAPEFNLDSGDENMKNFIEQYKKKYQTEPEIYAARAYDSVIVIGIAIEECGSDDKTECIKNELFKIKNHQGISGEISFDENGDVLREFELKIVKNGKIIPYKDIK